MASFLDGSDLMVDLILSSAGRRLMAEGRFNPVKFALHDDEIVYDKHSLYTDATGKFEGTPILEAISDNNKHAKYNLLTLGLHTTHLVSTALATDSAARGTPQTTNSDYIIVSTEDTYTSQLSSADLPSGYLLGYDKTATANNSDFFIKVDHGVNDDTSDGPYSWRETLPSELTETQFVIKMDHRLGRLLMPNSDPGVLLRPISVDDHHVATYIITNSPRNPSMSSFFETLPSTQEASQIKGGRAPHRSLFAIAAAPNINTRSTTIWTDLGTTEASFFTSGDSAYVIQSTLTGYGLNTNWTLSVPLRFIKAV